MSDDPTTGLLAPIARLVRMTEGQLATSLLGVALAGTTLAIGLPPVFLTSPTAPAETTPAVSDVEPGDVGQVEAPRPELALPSATEQSAPPAESPAAGGGDGPPSPSTPPAAPGTRGPEPDDENPEPACPARAAIDATRDTLDLVDEATGGAVPDGSVIGALSVVTGCEEADPRIVLLGALVELGEGLPDPGLGFIELPAVPYVELPAQIVSALQPARPALDPICAQVSTASQAATFAGPSYPAPIDATFAVALLPALSLCGQLQEPGR